MKSGPENEIKNLLNQLANPDVKKSDKNESERKLYAALQKGLAENPEEMRRLLNSVAGPKQFDAMSKLLERMPNPEIKKMIDDAIKQGSLVSRPLRAHVVTPLQSFKQEALKDEGHEKSNPIQEQLVQLLNPNKNANVDKLAKNFYESLNKEFQKNGNNAINQVSNLISNDEDLKKISLLADKTNNPQIKKVLNEAIKQGAEHLKLQRPKY